MTGKVGITIVVMMLLAFGVMFRLQKNWEDNFDKKFKENPTISAELIKLDSKGTPSQGDFPVWVPEGTTTLSEYPRLYTVYDKCDNYTLPKETAGVYALTERFNPEAVSVSVPQHDTGTVNVCRSTPGKVEILMWVKLSDGEK